MFRNKFSKLNNKSKKITKIKGVSSRGRLNKSYGNYHDPFMSYNDTLRQGKRT